MVLNRPHNSSFHPVQFSPCWPELYLRNRCPRLMISHRVVASLVSGFWTTLWIIPNALNQIVVVVVFASRLVDSGRTTRARGRQTDRHHNKYEEFHMSPSWWICPAGYVMLMMTMVLGFSSHVLSPPVSIAADELTIGQWPPWTYLWKVSLRHCAAVAAIVFSKNNKWWWSPRIVFLVLY